LDIKIRERNDIIIIDIIGDFLKSTSNVSYLHECVKEQIKEGKRNFLLNLENIDNIDYYGVGEMLASAISVNNSGGNIKFTPIKFFVEHDLKIGCGIWVYEDEKDAIKSFF
jgi:anti-anti-sigma regulatory factor